VEASIIIPTRNRPDALARILDKLTCEIEEHALADKVEIVVVDDASDRPAADELPQHYRATPFLKLLRLARNGGASAARNLGVTNSMGRILILIDDDIVPAEDYIRATLREHQAHPEILALNGNLRPLRDDVYSRFWFYYYAAVFNRAGGLYQVPMLASGNCSIKRALLEIENPLFDPSLPTREDFDLYLRLKIRGIPMFKSDRILAFNDCRRSLFAFVAQRMRYVEGHRHLARKYDAAFLEEESPVKAVPMAAQFLHLYLVLAVARRALALKNVFSRRS